MPFILACKPSSPMEPCRRMSFLEAKAALGTKMVRRWLGDPGEIKAHRCANEIPLRTGPHALPVSWVERTATREENGQIVYQNAWSSDFTIDDTNVQAIVRDGRARWKVENESNNFLKTKGYYLEHNFGHGHEHLAALLLSLNRMAFLFHILLGLVDEHYRAVRRKLGPRRSFFQDLDALLRYLDFPSWEDALTFMEENLQLDSG